MQMQTGAQTPFAAGLCGRQHRVADMSSLFRQPEDPPGREGQPEDPPGREGQPEDPPGREGQPEDPPGREGQPEDPPGREGVVVERDLAAVARAIIDTNRYMTLATADREGRPWASPVWYAAGNYTEFYWVSAPEATHSRNLATRPQVGIVIFDSGVPAGAGQGVYMSATAEQVPDLDLDLGLAVYSGPAESRSALAESSSGPAESRSALAESSSGLAEARWLPLTPEQLRAPAPYRLYRATVSEHSVLCPRGTGACALHGLPFDHRAPVLDVGRSRS
jgi:hypothetical protein